jgi:hypothetical protein
MTPVEAPRAATGGPRIWPLSVNAYRALGDLGLIPEKPEEYDRFKLRAYASAGVKECWLVLGPEKQIEVHRQPNDGQYTDSTLYGPGGVVTSEAVPSLTVGPSSPFVR